MTKVNILMKQHYIRVAKNEHCARKQSPSCPIVVQCNNLSETKASKALHIHSLQPLGRSAWQLGKKATKLYVSNEHSTVIISNNTAW